MLILADDVSRPDAENELMIWADMQSFEFQSRINQMLSLAISELVNGPGGKDTRRRRPWELLSTSDMNSWVASLSGVADPPQAELITRVIVCCTEQLLSEAHTPSPKSSSRKRTTQYQ